MQFWEYLHLYWERVYISAVSRLTELFVLDKILLPWAEEYYLWWVYSAINKTQLKVLVTRCGFLSL